MVLCLHGLPRAWRSLNTDFPNYYLAARLVHEGYDTSRMYEWAWIEREKDHRGIDDRVIGLLPITPFSTLAVLPLASLQPLAAKHAWILINLALLVPLVWLLRDVTGMSNRRIVIVLLLSFPLYRNLLYGQFYILLLLLLSAACWSYLRGRGGLAGALVAVAAACKVFPLLFFIFFLQRRDWRALAFGTFTGLATITTSIAVFGVSANRTWLQEILPWVMRGEGLGTYATSASISGVLHCVLLPESQWNPHPWHTSALLYAILSAVVPALLLAPAILLIRKDDGSRSRIVLEWSALLTATLTISTIAASYNFVLMALPACALGAVLLRERRYGWFAALIAAYLGIGFPLPVPAHVDGLELLLYVPRLPLMIAVLAGNYALLWRDRSADAAVVDWSRLAWVSACVAAVSISAHTTYQQERAQREEYAFRVPLRGEGFLNAQPQATGDSIQYVSFTLAGYRLVTESAHGLQEDVPTDRNADDISFAISLAGGSPSTLVERASAEGSEIVDLVHDRAIVAKAATEPMLSADARDLAFIEEDHGRGRLMLRRSFLTSGATAQLTPVRWNVYEASVVSPAEYAVAAVDAGAGWPAVHLFDSRIARRPIEIADARYPALSGDGRWLAYSHREHGVWNLWVMDEGSGVSHRIADVPCNQIQPSWESDAKTLLYGTDCGRSVWFTAIARRRVVP